MSTVRVAMLGQGYTPITSAPMCANCVHRVFTEPEKGRGRSCALGGFYVSACGTCDRHEAMPALGGGGAPPSPGAAKIEAQGAAS